MIRGQGRTPVVRWAWRLFRRDWRQQALVLGLLTLAVAAAVGGAATAYNTAGVTDDALFGAADHRIHYDLADPGTLVADVAAARDHFGAVEVITHQDAPIPGSADTVEYRAQDPEGRFGRTTLDVRAGRYPSGPSEVAVTDGVADLFDLSLGGTLTADGVERRVVGRVENPHDLHVEFALVAVEDMPAQAAASPAPDSVTLLVVSGSEQASSFRAPGFDEAEQVETAERVGDAALDAALGVLATATLAMVLVALLATAGFLVVAQRRLRQLGMLMAVGATPRHVRLVMMADGALIGGAAAVLGATLGFGAWVLVMPRLEQAVGHRIDAVDVPWWVMGGAMVLAVVTATGAAWWPARVAASVPVTRALTGRPPQPRSVRASASAALVLLVLGVMALARSHQTDARLVVPGTLAVVVGVLLLAPSTIRLLAFVGRRLPVAPRLAMRDLGRYQGRAGVSVAAVSLTLGVSAAILVSATAAADVSASEGNLSERQLLIRIDDVEEPGGACPGPVQAGSNGPCPFLPMRTPAEIRELEAVVDDITRRLDPQTVSVLDAAFDPDIPPEGPMRPGISLTADEPGLGRVDISLVYVATPELLAAYGLGAVALEDRDHELLTVETEQLEVAGVAVETDARRYVPEAVSDHVPLEPGYTSLPGSFVTPQGVARRGWEAARVGWLVESERTLSDDQIEAARDRAAGAGLLVEGRDRPEGLASLRLGATGVGMVVALAVLAMTVGLLRGEVGRELRALVAAGATSYARRAVTAATAGGLAVLGAVLGIFGAYVGLAAGSAGGLGSLHPVPVVHLGLIGLGVPLLAAVVGWLLAGREPTSLTRHSLD